MQRKRNRRGSVLVELALLTPLMILLLLGGVHFGYFFYLYNQLDKSVRDGARYAATRTYETNATDGNALYTTAIKNVVVYGDAQSTTSPVVPSLTATSSVTVTPIPATGRPQRIKVYINSYTYHGVLGTLTLTTKPSMEVPFIGRYVSE